MSERKFTVLNLKVSRLGAADVAYLSLYALLVIAYYVIEIVNNIHNGIFGLVIAMVSFVMVGSSPFGLRFRNLYFSLSWLVLSLLFLVNNSIIAATPTCLFVLYHILRLIFWNNQKKEFIPFQIGRGGNMYRHFDALEGRNGGPKDKKMMTVLFWLSLLILIAFLALL